VEKGVTTVGSRLRKEKKRISIKNPLLRETFAREYGYRRRKKRSVSSRKKKNVMPVCCIADRERRKKENPLCMWLRGKKRTVALEFLERGKRTRDRANKGGRKKLDNKGSVSMTSL